MTDAAEVPRSEASAGHGELGGELDRVRAFLTARYGDRAGGAAPLAGGEWSRAYAFTLDGHDLVLRFGGHGEDYAKDQLMGGLGSGALPIPRVLEVGEAFGGYYAVSERAPGGGLDELDGPGMRAALPSLLRALDAIRDLDVAGTFGYGLWTPDRRAPHPSWAGALLDVAADRDRIPGWRAALAGSGIGMRPIEVGLARLAELVPALPAERQVVHGDLLNGNMLVAGGRVSAVLDWGNAMYGDHLYDAALLIHWWPWHPEWTDIDLRRELFGHWERHGGVPESAAERLLAYQLHIALEAITYCSFRRRWAEVADSARRVLALAGQPPGG